MPLWKRHRPSKTYRHLLAKILFSSRICLQLTCGKSHYIESVGPREQELWGPRRTALRFVNVIYCWSMQALGSLNLTETNAAEQRIIWSVFSHLTANMFDGLTGLHYQVKKYGDIFSNERKPTPPLHGVQVKWRGFCWLLLVPSEALAANRPGRGRKREKKNNEIISRPWIKKVPKGTGSKKTESIENRHPPYVLNVLKLRPWHSGSNCLA